MPNLIASITPTFFCFFKIFLINSSSSCIQIFSKIFRLSFDKISFLTISFIKSFVEFLFSFVYMASSNLL